MQQSQVKEQLHDYIVKRILDGKDIGLDDTTPLLEWGVINSIEIMRLLSFIEQNFAVHVPGDQMIADNFTTIGAITNMIVLCEQNKRVEQ